MSKKNKRNKPNGPESDPSQMNGGSGGDEVNGADELRGVSDDLSWVNGATEYAEPLDDERLVDPLADPDASGPEPEPEPEYEIPVSTAKVLRSRWSRPRLKPRRR